VSYGAQGELDRVLGGSSLLHPAHGDPGGEWDALRALDRSTLRRLTGARLLTPHGLRPDVAADIIARNVARIEDVDDAMAWFVRTALDAITERRRAAHHRRHALLARRHGYRTYHQYRTFQSVLRGHDSLWYERCARWPEAA
jgi:hypothetical protein